MERQGILALAWGVETRGLAALKKQRTPLGQCRIMRFFPTPHV
jgi:hypothetical protein